jgi:hypothetical protein
MIGHMAPTLPSPVRILRSQGRGKVRFILMLGII